jgi:Zn-dependent protease
VPQPQAAELLRAMGNPGQHADVRGLIFPAEASGWFAIVSWDAAGYVKDDDAKEWNAEELLQSYRDGTEAANAERQKVGATPIEVVGWAEKPAYDAGTHRLVWAMSLRDQGAAADAEQSVNYNTYALGREGLIKLLLLLLSGAKFGKLLTSGGTMLVSLVAYAFVFGWKYAAGFVVLLFVHEMGHYMAARQRGLAVGLPTFIPFVGAWVELKDLPHDAETEAWVGLGGPLLGTVGALGVYFVARETGATWLLAVAYAGFFLNLFNLIPLSPFDGGRITAVLSPRIWLLGVPILVGLFFWRPSPMLLI